MCEEPRAKPTAEGAAKDLARLVENQLGYAAGHVDPIALRLFIRAYWSRISVLAHVIHDEKVCGISDYPPHQPYRQTT